MKHIWLMLILAFCVSGCGNKVDHSHSEKAVSSANALLDSGNYEGAIAVLEPLHEVDKGNSEVSGKLLHAYAGAGSFQAVKVMGIWKEIEVALDDMKKKNEKKATDILKDIEKLLEPIPVLTEKQKERLDQAIALYQELGLEVETAGKYNNFKWGVLHTYRLAITLKEIVVAVKSSQNGNEKLDLKAIEKVAIPRLKIMSQDLFMAYKLYGNSFDKIKKITESVDKLIARTIKDDSFKLKVNTLAKNESEFFKSLLNDNISAAGILLGKLGDIYQNNGHKEKVKELVAKIPMEEIKASQKRMEALVKIFIQQFNEEHPEIENRLKSIFTDQLKAEVIESIKICIREKNTDALKELLESKRPEVEVLKSYYLILKGDFEASGLEEELKAEVEIIKKKVDLEMLKTELEEIAVAFKEDARIVEVGAKALVEQNKERLAERKTIIEKEINSLKADLEDVTDELKENLGAEDQDKETEEAIIRETIDLVEND